MQPAADTLAHELGPGARMKQALDLGDGKYL